MAPTYEPNDDTPRTYAASLVSALAELKHFDAEPFDPDESQFPGNTTALQTAVSEAFDQSVGASRLYRNGEALIVEFPNRARDGLDDSLADNVSLVLAYKPNGRVKVLEARYSNESSGNMHSLYAGYLDEFDVERAFHAGADAAKYLFDDYINAGLSPTQALDFGVTVGLGHPFQSWTMRRDIGYEGGRKNRAEARDTLREAGWTDELTERDAHIARCSTCGRNMQTADSCDEERTLIDEDKNEFDPVLYGEERKYTDEAFRERAYPDEDIRPGKEPDGQCHDCGISPGNVHHDGCDWEECPQCGGQLLSCKCNWFDIARNA